MTVLYLTNYVLCNERVRYNYNTYTLIQPSENAYGLPWRAGDIITCCIDLEDGTMGYWLNGEPMGIAFTDIDKKEEWYPVCINGL